MTELLILPDGFLGRIARRPRNIDPVDFEKVTKKWRYFRNIHPVYMLDKFLWEREKNIWRKWWFHQTPAERKYMIDRRNEYFFYDKTHAEAKIFQNAQYAKEFKGPRYQLGALMGGSVRRAIHGGGAVLSLSASNNTATNVDISPPGALDAGFGLTQGGNISRTNSSGTNNINTTTDYVTPRDATVGNDYEVIWNTLTSSFNDENFTEDVWTQLSSLRYVGHSTSAPSVFRTFEYDIGDNGTSTSDVNQDYTVECGDII